MALLSEVKSKRPSLGCLLKCTVAIYRVHHVYSYYFQDKQNISFIICNVKA